jgi:hypothetical protein
MVNLAPMHRVMMRRPANMTMVATVRRPFEVLLHHRPAVAVLNDLLVRHALAPPHRRL